MGISVIRKYLLIKKAKWLSLAILVGKSPKAEEGSQLCEKNINNNL
jgi:hypothetical protein